MRTLGSPAENVRLARLRARMEPEDVARAVGLSKPSYFDVEAYDVDVTGVVSLGTLAALAETLGTTTLELLDGPGTTSLVSKRSLLEVVEVARTRMASDGLTIDSYGDRIGCDLAPVFANPEYLMKYPFEVLHALCEDLGLDWKEFVDGPVSSV